MTTQDEDWVKLTRTVKWRKRTLAFGEIVAKMVRGIDWEDVAWFVGIMVGVVFAFLLIMAGIHSASHSNDLKEHRKEVQVEACKSAGNVDACLARLN